jgi:alpha-L-fucosidase
MSTIRYEPNWESLKQFTVPDWYINAKFGIFIHWGVYAVPAFGNEWYPRNMYLPDQPEFAHHIATFGPQAQFGYKDFIPQFTADKFDAGAWAALFKQAGAKFVMPVAEHHDGFAMYDSSFSRWCATKMGPQRDIIGELATATREAGMVFGVSSHRAEHCWFMNGGRAFDSDVNDPRFEDFYGPAQPKETQPSDEYLQDWLARTNEIVDKYQPQVVWFDWWIEEPAFAPYLQQFAARYYNKGIEWNKGVAINYKHKAFADGTAVYDIERGQLSGINPLFWQTDTAVSKNSWGYVANQDYKRTGDIIGDLIDIVSKNGALLLNIGPRPDGTIPEPEQAMLLEIGEWLSTNGEAIYGTRPWKAFGEGPTEVAEGSFTDTQRSTFTAQDFRFTQKENALYAICMAKPCGDVAIRSLGKTAGLNNTPIACVNMLGSDAPLAWRNDDEALVISLPAMDLPDTATTFKITFAG